MNIPCDKRSNECGCEASDFSNPFANLSSEDPDRRVFIRNYNFREGGSGWCEEVNADNLADCIVKQEQTINKPPICRDCNPPTDANIPTIYYSKFTACVSCGYSYFIPAGTYISYVSQADADARAQSACVYRACDPNSGPRRTIPPVVPCAVETGIPCPIGTEAFHLPRDPVTLEAIEVEWETVVVDLNNVIETPNDPGSNIGWYRWPSQPDHPPGRYQVEYIGGFFENTLSACPPITPNDYWIQLNLEDEEKFYQWPGVSSYLTNDLRDAVGAAPPPPPASGAYGIGFNICAAGSIDGEIQFQAYFNGDPKKRWCGNPSAGHDHSNTGGMFAVENIQTGFGGIFANVVGHPMTLKIIQADGLIQQSRQIQIIGWSSVGPKLGAGIYVAWDGVFTTRTTYTDTQCEWNEPGFGLFGGAICSYSQTHPTSPNGCGWILEIYNSGGLVWEGYKIIDDTSIGLYQVAVGSPNQTVQCIRIIGVP